MAPVPSSPLPAPDQRRLTADDAARLLITCPDRDGIVAAVSGFLAEHGANITSSHQHTTDPRGGRFFMRMEFARAGLTEDRASLEEAFAREVAGPLDMTWRMTAAGDRKRMAIFVSRYDHCLLDLLWRLRSGELDADLTLVVSNHEDLREEAERFGARYVHIPVTRDSKAEAEAEALELLTGNVDLVVLARYMQVLSADFLDRLDAPVINIHHSFLPAFAGADPYRRAHTRGVKIIGATAHYVTPELDAGPIIEQDVVRVTHADGVDALTGFGRDVERYVLSRAVRFHLEDRVLIDGDRTVVLG
jgi:formyltetrahydrofolate deformylase